MKLNCYSVKSYLKFPKLLILILLFLLINSNAESTTVTISVSSNQFSPNNVSVNVGDSIKWQWVNGFHNTTSNTIPPGAATWVAPIDNSNPSFTYRISVAGTYNYECTFHAGMTGQINAAQGSLLTENFDYPVGDSIGSHGWNWISGTTNILRITSPGLVYAGYPLSNIGFATTFTTSGEDSYKEFFDSVNTGSVYACFMVKIDGAQRQGDYFVALLQTGSTTNYEGRLSARVVDGNINFGITKGNSSTDTSVAGIWSTGNYSLGTTYLVVLKYTFITGVDNDAVSLFVFSSGVPAIEPTPTVGPISSYASADARSLGRIAIRQGTATRAPNGIVDGFKVSTSWDFSMTSISNGSNNISDNFNLAQNYPNPFNPNTTIKYTIAEKGFINLTVYNSLGEEVSNLVNSGRDKGAYTVDFNGSGLNSGIYFYKLTYTNNSGNNFVDTKKLILLK